MSGLWNSFKIAFAMYSKIPMPKSDWDKEKMRYTMCFFPLIGVVIGALMEVWNFFAWNQAESMGVLRIAILVLVPVIITGGIHLDGFLDTSDALSSWQPMEKRLEILKDSRSGAFAVIMGCCYFLLNFGVYAGLDYGTQTFHVVCLTFIFSRALSGLGIVVLKKAKDTGLAATFSDSAQKRIVAITMVVYLVIVGVLMLVISPMDGMWAILTALCVFWYYRHMSYKYFGGITGDLAGWFLQVCELAVALVLVLRMYLMY